MAPPETFGGYVRKTAAMVLNLFFPATYAHNLLLQTDNTALAALKTKGVVPGKRDITYLFPYGNPIIKNLIWELKYRGDPCAVLLCAEALYGELLQKTLVWEEEKGHLLPLLIPLPLSKKRFRKRGFNQTELMARKMSDMDSGIHFTVRNDVLYKIKDTKSQTTIKDKIERRKNVLGCFSVKDRNALAGRIIILIDDVVTTGSTIKEAKKTLLEAGALKVVVLAVAH